MLQIIPPAINFNEFTYRGQYRDNIISRAQLRVWQIPASLYGADFNAV